MISNHLCLQCNYAIRFDMILEFYVRYAAQCTIRQHYYPENCWGWIIVVTGVMVQILTTGIQGAAGAWLLLDGTKRYRQTLLNVGT